MRVAVIGAGLAGLAAACDLADVGYQVTLFEQRPWAGGKTYSYVDAETGETADNGQHVFMNCTSAYVRFLEKLGTLALTNRQERLCVPVFDERGRRSDLWAADLPAPLHLAPSFVAYRHLSAAEKLRIVRAIVSLARERVDIRRPAEQTFEAWLRRHGQTDREIERFWDLIVVPSLNCACAEADAAQAIFVFQEGFLRSARSAAIGVSTVGLSSLHVLPAIEYVCHRGGTFHPHTHVRALQVEADRVVSLRLGDGASEQFDAYIAAVPPRQALGLLPIELRSRPPFSSLSEFRYDPIVNLHCWFDAPVADFEFAAFTGSHLQWVFNRTRIEGRRHDGASGASEHLTISLSYAHRYVGESRRALEQRFIPEIHQLLPRSRAARLLRFTALKEPEATFRPAPRLRRPGPVTPIDKLYLAGAYTATGWPATMESAVRSGVAAAKAVAARFHEIPSRVLAGVP